MSKESSASVPELSLDEDVRKHVNPNWPGLTVPAGQIRVDPQELLAVAARLRAAVDRLKSIPEKVAQEVTPVSFGPQNWGAAANLQQGHEVLSKALSEFVQYAVGSGQEASTAMRVAVKQVTASDQDSQVTAARTDSSAGGGEVVVL